MKGADERAEARREFLADYLQVGVGEGELRWEALQPDASFRRYFRVGGAGEGAGAMILMDAPRPMEDVGAFVKVTEHLQRLGARVPAIYACDGARGFVLMEDLGEETYTRLLEAGGEARGVYRQAIRALCGFQQHAAATEIDLPLYEAGLANEESCLLLDWYLPARLGRAGVVSAGARAEFLRIWEGLLGGLPALPPTLVLRDFHLGNLMAVGGECALLDYQDAVIGSPAYDLVSLLEDARRDLTAEFAEEVLEFYLQEGGGGGMGMARADLRRHCLVWGAQRHCKVAGIFVRLWLRDGKEGYLQHLPRVVGLLRRALEAEELRGLRDWFARNVGGEGVGVGALAHGEFAGSREELRRICGVGRV